MKNKKEPPNTDGSVLVVRDRLCWWLCRSYSLIKKLVNKADI